MMNIRTNIPVLILLIISNEFHWITCKSQDDLCPKMYGVLCVKDVLATILSASKQINEISKEIEQTIVREIKDMIITYRLILFFSMKMN